MGVVSDSTGRVGVRSLLNIDGKQVSKQKPVKTQSSLCAADSRPDLFKDGFCEDISSIVQIQQFNAITQDSKI